MFQETLSGEALSWFYELLASSIDSFMQLADRFVNRFILRTDGQSTNQLFKVKQGHGEGLKAFVNRWQGATAKVRSFDKKVAEEAFVQALLPGKFLYAVKIENPRGYDELMEMAIRHAQADHDTYEDQSVVWNENKGAIPGPPTRKFPPSRLTREDTRYHREATHAINNCVELKRAIEGQIKRGKLQQYVSGQRQGAGVPIYGTINTIRGGARLDQRSNKDTGEAGPVEDKSLYCWAHADDDEAAIPSGYSDDLGGSVGSERLLCHRPG
ncbi:PREDICTED: uncharacterized protein LOC101303383 [Fragaria vesca subsp. vesca]